MGDFKWQKFDFSEQCPIRLEESDECYFAREYTARGGFAASHTNDLISNLKKPVGARGQQYKENAISQFAGELRSLLRKAKRDLFIAAIPSSKCKDDQDYDDRLERVIAKACDELPRVALAEPIRRTETCTPAHHSQDRRDISNLLDRYEWMGLPKDDRGAIILVDDVITTGTSFKACQALILQHCPDIHVVGLFWAKTIWPQEEIEIDISRLIP